MAKDLRARKRVLTLDEITRALLPSDAQPAGDQVTVRIRDSARSPPRDVDFATFGSELVLEWMEEETPPRADSSGKVKDLPS